MQRLLNCWAVIGYVLFWLMCQSGGAWSASAVTEEGARYYTPSDLGLSCVGGGRRLGLSIFHQVRGPGSHEIVHPYASAVVYGDHPNLGTTRLSQQKGPVYYCLLFPGNYSDLDLMLSRIEECYKVAPMSPRGALTPTECPLVELEEVLDRIRRTNVVCFTLGAGMSAGYVPTLSEFFSSLGLRVAHGTDVATEETFVPFLAHLLENPLEGMQRVRDGWMRIADCSVATTPAHEAVRNLQTLLTDRGKDVYIYTGNLDGIHERAGIKLAEVDEPSDGVQCFRTLLPPASPESHVLVLMLGQSSDFHDGILSILAANPYGSISFIAVNISPATIWILDRSDPVVPGDSWSWTDPRKPLPMRCLQGSVHDLLPRLLKELQCA